MSVDALSAVLQGFERGFGRGIDLYKTIEGEKRARRMEERQLRRDAVDDERYEASWQRQLGLDKAATEQRELDNAHRTDVFDFTKLQHADNQEWKRRQYEATKAAAAATAAYRARNLQLRADGHNFRVNKEVHKQLGEKLETFAQAYTSDPATALKIYSTDVDLRIEANRRALGDQARGLSDDQLSQLYAMDMGGKLVFGRFQGEQLVPFDTDPETDGVQALTFDPATVFARVSGKAGQDALATAVGNSRADAVEGEYARLAERTTLAGGNQQVEGLASRAGQIIEERGQLADTLRVLGDVDGTPLHTKYQKHGMSLSGVNPELAQLGVRTERERSLKLAEVRRSLAALENEEGGINARLREVSRDMARDLGMGQDRAANLGTSLRNIPLEGRSRAANNTFEVLQQPDGSGLAVAYPGQTYGEASAQFAKDRTAYVDSVIRQIDTKTSLGGGKRESPVGASGEIAATLHSMGPEILQIISADPTGQVDGALRHAVQVAAKQELPQAVPHILRAVGSGLKVDPIREVLADRGLRKQVEDPQAFGELAYKVAEMATANPKLYERIGAGGLAAQILAGGD